MNRSRKRALWAVGLVVLFGLLLVGFLTWLAPSSRVPRRTHIRSDLQGIAMQLTMYKGMNGSYPTTEQGLKALVTKPESEPRPRNWVQGLRELPVDAWGREYIYLRPGKKNTDSYDLYSAGEDQMPDTADDVWPQ